MKNVQKLNEMAGSYEQPLSDLARLLATVLQVMEHLEAELEQTKVALAAEREKSSWLQTSVALRRRG